MKGEIDYLHLIRLTLSGNKEAYSELYDVTIQEVYKTAHFLIEDKTDVDDVVQEVYIQLYETLRKYDSEKPFRPWLIGLAIKQIHSYRRKRWMRLRIIKKAEEQRKPVQIDFSNDLVSKISNQKLIELIHKLPYKLKQVIILRYLHGYSQEEAKRIVAPPELKEKVIVQIKMKRGGSKRKKRLIAGVLAAALLIPTTGFAYQSIMADGIYGSFENLKKHAGARTLEAYMRFNAKLSEAKDEMDAKEYEEFTKELKKLTNAKLAYGDSNGNIDYDALSPAKREEMKKVSMGLQPYFDKLNGHKSSREVLTQEEFDRYMEALMTHEIV